MPLEHIEGLVLDQSIDLLALDDALEQLTQMDERLGQLVELRFFGGLTVDEAAKILGVSPRTAKSDWKMAKVWLKRAIG